MTWGLKDAGADRNATEHAVRAVGDANVRIIGGAQHGAETSGELKRAGRVHEVGLGGVEACRPVDAEAVAVRVRAVDEIAHVGDALFVGAARRHR